jgi:ATP-dependent DNA helicase RecG
MEQKELDIYEILEQNQLLEESFELECKSARGGLPGSLWETYVAFANSEGGNIVLGITEKEESLQIDGLSQAQVSKFQQDFWNQVNNRGKVSVNILSERHVKSIEVASGKFILAIHVPAADYRSKPVHIGPDPLRGTYKRNHTGDYLCTHDEVRQMIADALPQKPDSRILDNYSLDDLDELSISQFRQLFRSAKPGHPFLAEDDKGLLTKTGAWRTDRHSKKEGLTVAGLLMFGKHQAIIDTFPDFHLDYQEVNDPNQRWSDRVFPDGTWEANIFQFYQRIWPKISGTLPKPFQLKDGQRMDESTLHEALREALVNALVHADYSAPGGVVIKKFPDYFVFSNPGNMLITTEQYYKGGISIPRNNSIQTLFVLLGFGEKAGSGSTRIFSAWEGLHWRKPYIQVSHQPSRFDLFLRMESLISPKSMDALVALYGEEIRSLYGNALIALTTAQIEGAITNTRLQQLIGVHSSEISKLLKELCGGGYLLPSGKGRGTVYQLNTQFLPLREESKQVIAPGIQGILFENNHAENNSPHVRVDTLGAKEDTSGAKEDTSALKEDTSGAKEDTSGAKEDTSIVQQRLKPDVLNRLILEFCQTEFKSVEEIGEHSGKTPKYLKDKVIPRLIEHKMLERLYPGTPNHPNQKYKTKV